MWRIDGLGFEQAARRWRTAAMATTLLVGCGGTTTERTGGGSHGGTAASGSNGSGGSPAATGGGSSGEGGTSGAGGSSGPDCSRVDCAVPDCAQGDTIVRAPGECCGTCQATSPGTSLCYAGLAFNYFMNTQVMNLNAIACGTDSDCRIVSLGNRCQPDCGTAVNTTQAAPLMKALQEYADANCSGCPPQEAQCPENIYTARCRGGQCAIVP